ncbi:hypothetical protein QFC19_004181 [Naganishia cerealis]|uniref:Uncharacterized protein n=1 Tax=Naganishia cerealis TaxID=610337 RepID=A0ACC2VXI8_9TREE|nr:hypothetical protein QFC19_004181 [Naganishia cerealis]
MALPQEQGIDNKLLDRGPDTDAAACQGGDSSAGASTNALGLYIEQPPEDCRYIEQRMEQCIKKEETTFVLRKPARSSGSEVPQPVGSFSSFSSPSSIPGVWPPSPSVTRSWKIANPVLSARKRKRKSGDLGREHVVGATEMESASGDSKRCRVEGWVQPTQPALGDPYGNTTANQDSSPDYRMMLNLSDTPTLSDTALLNPFVQTTAQPVQTPTFHMLSALSRDQSLSPTVRNPSIDSLDSNDLSVACLAPAEGKTSVFFGRFGCSDTFSERVLGGQDDEAAIRAKKDEEKRLAGVIENWMSGLLQAQMASRNLVSRPGFGSVPTTTATVPVQTYHFPRNIESSAGLLDAVCEIASLAYGAPGGNVGGGSQPPVVAPGDLRIRVGQGTAPVIGVSGRQNMFVHPIGSRGKVSDDQEKEGQRILERVHVMVNNNVESKRYQSDLKVNLTIGSWTRYPKTNLDDQAETTFAYTPFENGDQRFSWAMFHANMHYRISIPFMSIQSLKCNSVPDERDAMALYLSLKMPPLFHVWDGHLGTWKEVSSFISTDDMLTHCLIGRRESLLPKVERILARTCPTDSAAGMFAAPSHVALATATQMFIPHRPSERVRPEREVIDLVTPPRPATDVFTNPVTPSHDGARGDHLILVKKRLGKDSSRVKMSTEAIANEKPAPDKGSALLSKTNDIAQGRQHEPSLPTARALKPSSRTGKTLEKPSEFDPMATIEGSLRHRSLPEWGTSSQLDQHGICHTLPHDKNSHWMPGAGTTPVSATPSEFAPPIMIPHPAAHNPYHESGSNMMGPFVAPNTSGYNFHAYPHLQSSSEASTTANLNDFTGNRHLRRSGRVRGSTPIAFYMPTGSDLMQNGSSQRNSGIFNVND